MINDYSLINVSKNNPQKLRVKGSVLVYKSATLDKPLIISAFDVSSNRPLGKVALLPGEKFRMAPGESFNDIFIESLSDESFNCVLTLGDGDFNSDRQSGSVIATIQETLDVNSVGGSLDSLGKIEPVDLGDFETCEIYNISGVNQVVAPVTNINGIHVAMASLSYSHARIAYAPSTPANFEDWSAKTCLYMVSSLQAGPPAIRKNFNIPAGMGIYALSGSGNCYGFVNYKVL